MCKVILNSDLGATLFVILANRKDAVSNLLIRFAVYDHHFNDSLHIFGSHMELFCYCVVVFARRFCCSIREEVLFRSQLLSQIVHKQTHEQILLLLLFYREVRNNRSRSYSRSYFVILFIVPRFVFHNMALFDGLSLLRFPLLYQCFHRCRHAVSALFNITRPNLNISYNSSPELDT